MLFSANVKDCITENIPEHSVYLYHKGNIDAIKSDMMDLSNTFLSSDPYSRTVEENWQLFKTCLQDSVSKNVPQKTIRNQNSLPWINHDIKCSMKKRKRLYDRAKQTGKPEDWAAYRLERNEVNSKLELAHLSYCNRLFDESFSGNRRQFWKYIRAKRKDATSISSLLVNGSLISESKGKATVLSDQFQSVFIRENRSDVPKL